MAATLRGSMRAGQPKSSWWKAVFARPTLAYALAGIVVAAIVAWIAVRSLHPLSAEQLLAQAYTEHRTIDVRIAGAKYAPLRIERSTSGSNFEKPESLLKAEGLISEKLRQDPRDPQWLEAKAQAELMDGNFEDAIRTLQSALESKPDSPQLLTDLGSAYFLRGRSTERAMDYGNAVESFSKALAKNPDDAIALFNRALACEQAFLYRQAIDDWEHYLRIDRSGGWADEARRRLDLVRRKMAEHDGGTGQLINPSTQTFQGKSNNAFSTDVENRGEEYLQHAVVDWIPNSILSSTDKSPDARRPLSAMARVMVETHSDYFIADFLRALETDSDQATFATLLADAHRANALGHYDVAMGQAKKAAVHFHQVNNAAGLIWARWEFLYATRLSYHAQECLAVGAPLLHDLIDNRYPWLRSRAALDYAQCAELTNKLELAKSFSDLSLRISDTHKFPDLYLRAIKVFADIALAGNESEVALDLAVRGLSRYWASHVDYMPGYNLYSCIDDIAEFNQMHFLDSYAIVESLTISGADPDLGMRAVMVQRLANALLLSGNWTGAQSQIEQLKSFISRFQASDDRVGKLADIQIFSAHADLIRSRPADAAARLEEFRSQIDKLRNDDLSLDFYSTLGTALFASGRDEEAKGALEKSASLAESGLRTIVTEHDRLLWSRRSDSIYRQLVRLEIARNPIEAFQWWEWYKAASLRTSRRLATSLPDSVATSLPAREVVKGILGDSIVLVSYAVFDDGIAIWVYDADRTIFKWVALSSSQVQKAAAEFVAFCSDPTSDIGALQHSGEELYAMLFEPVESLIGSRRIVIVEPDGVLDRIPFEALVRHDRTYLIDSLGFSYSPGLHYLTHSQHPKQFTAQTRVLVTIDTLPHDDLHIPGLPDAEAEGRVVTGSFANSVLLKNEAVTVASISREIPNAEIVHFSGHGVSGTSGSGLVVYQGDDTLKSRVLSVGDLPYRSLYSTRLVILSACASAEGNGPGGMTDSESLARSFVARGVTQVMATRWSIDSEFAIGLMSQLYEQLRAGSLPSTSLWIAERTARQNREFSHPFYWAAFSSIGRV
jgi:CHAT domain-containing protein/cytochrome c-type biogenesis protein CcmH/NrfG